jgi:hypothetical protein
MRDTRRPSRPVQWFTDLDPPTLDQLRRFSDLYRREWKRLAQAGLPAPCPLVPDPDGSASAALRRECGLKGRDRGRAPSGAGTLLAVLDRRGRITHDGPYGPVAEAAIEEVLDDGASEP